MEWASAVQVGSLVPAESAVLHVVDAVHTRMGASDNLAMGSSTFLEVTPILCSFFSLLSCWSTRLPKFLLSQTAREVLFSLINLDREYILV